MKKAIILLTGTVNPNGMSLTKLQDSEVRKIQYISSLDFWLKKTNLPIVFVENSGVDLSSHIGKEFSDRIEFLTFRGNDYPREFGKGYGEIKCLEYAVEHSNFFKHCDFVFKATGRLKILGFKRLYNYYLENSDMFIFLDFRRSLTFVDSRFFGCNPDFLTHFLLRRKDEVNDSKQVIFENVLAKSVLEAVVAGFKFNPLPYYPEFSGKSGTDNINYKSGFLYFLAKRAYFFLKARFINE